MAPKSVTFRRHDHLVSVLFGDLLSHSYNIIFSMFFKHIFTLKSFLDMKKQLTLVESVSLHCDMPLGLRSGKQETNGSCLCTRSTCQKSPQLTLESVNI